MEKFYAGYIKKMFQVHFHIQQVFFRLNEKGKIQNVNLREKEHQNVRIVVSIIYQKMMMPNDLSTAFDSVTLYGEDPDYRPDIYGKVGECGVNVCTLDDMKKLYDGFDLCAPSTSVSMTINGPAPIILAMFINTAIDQQVRIKEEELGRTLNSRRIYRS